MEHVPTPGIDLPSRSAKAVLYSGVILGAVLALVMGYVIYADRQARLGAAERDSEILVGGVERLVWLELRNLERALRGIAGDAEQLSRQAPAQAPALIAESMAGVATRQPELESLVLVDASGRALTPGRSDPTLPEWFGDAGARMSIGPLQSADGGWVVPMAVAMADGRRVLAYLHTSEMQRLVQHIDPGRFGRVRVIGRHGRVAADTHGPAYIGQMAAGDPHPGQTRRFATRRTVDPQDGVVRLLAAGTLPDYPMAVSVGLTERTVLAPWWILAASGLLLYLLYWGGLAYLVRVVGHYAADKRALVRQVQAAAEELRLAQRLGRTGSWSAEHGGPLRWSEPVAELIGLHPSQTEASTEDFYAMMHPDDRTRVAELFEQAWRSGEPFTVDYRVVVGDGSVRWLTARGALVPGVQGVARMSGTVVDATDLMQAQQSIAEAERRFRLLFDRNPLPFWVFDRQTLRFLEVNDAAVKQYGYSREEFMAMTLLDIRPQEQNAQLVESLEHAREIEHDDTQIWLHRRKDGSLLEVRVYASDIELQGRPARLVLAEDVTERLAYQRELAYRARHDMSSGLLNAATFAAELQARGAGRIAYVQLRGLELIEDSLGRQTGEQMLRGLAQRLGRLGEAYGAVGHMRTQEFALAVHDHARWPQALDALQAELARPVAGEDSVHRLEAWLGVADFPDDGEDAAQALGNAAIAAHVAHAERRPLVQFEASMARRASDRLRLAGRVHRAIENGEFELHFQIIRHVEDGRAAALEALIRWPQPDGSFIAPSEFIAICEDTGLIVPLGRWVIAEAARAHRRLAEAGFAALPVAVNVSLAQFVNTDLAEDFDAVLGDLVQHRGALHVELTESILMTRPEQALEVLRRLQKRGICVSLDDFGTGYSSLSYLRHLPLDALKIDRSFVADVDRDPRNASICRTLLALGHSLGLTVIAEGVETPGQFHWLRAHGCDQVQGYGLDRPAPLAQVLARLRALESGDALPWPVETAAAAGTGR